MTEQPVRWRLKAKHDQRFRTGHPWVYSNELQESPKGLAPGARVDLYDPSGKFLARGFGNPHSLIAFRALSRREGGPDPLSVEGLVETLRNALRYRCALGLERTSFRWVFGEADGLPGLILDRYAVTGHEAQVLVLQAHTAGIDRALSNVVAALEQVVRAEGFGEWETTSIVVRNDVSVRKLEGIPVEAARAVRSAPAPALENLREVSADIRGYRFDIDVLEGQKTGFFLDQVDNIEQAARWFRRVRAPGSSSRVRILDLCPYIGHWSVRLARALIDSGAEPEVTAVDISDDALARVERHVRRSGVKHLRVERGDALKDLGGYADESFDIVVCDPPALVPARKDLPQGTHAYLQLNTQVLRLVRRGGAVASCSCSGLLPEANFVSALEKAARRNQRIMRWARRGHASADHPVLAGFPEGQYLKTYLGFSE